MRTMAAIVLFAAAGISAASAQQPAAQPKGSWSPDPAQAASADKAKAGDPATAGGSPKPSQSTNFHVNGDNVIAAVPPLTPEQAKAEALAQAEWLARCRPTVIEDREGLRRTHYAAPDCDLSRFNTAGK
jgi:hypothetical protein